MNKSLLGYIQIVNKAIENNILTNDSLAHSAFAEDYWIICHELAQTIVFYNYTNICASFKSISWDCHDITMEFTILLHKGFQSYVNASLHPKKDENGKIKPFSPSGYINKSFTYFVCQCFRKNVVKVKRHVKNDTNNKKKLITDIITIINEDGIKAKTYYKFISIYSPISDDESLTLGDTIASEQYNTEAEALLNVIEAENKANIYKKLKMLFSQKYYSQAYIFIQDTLDEYGYECSIDNMLELFRNYSDMTPFEQQAAKKAFVDAYNNDMLTMLSFLQKECDPNIDTKLIYDHIADNFEEFGRDFKISKQKFYSLRSNYKKKFKCFEK